MSRLKVNAKDKKMKVMEEIEKADWLGLRVIHGALGLVELRAKELVVRGEGEVDEEGYDDLVAKIALAERAIARRMVALRGHVAWAHDAPEWNNDLGPVIEGAIWRMIEREGERIWEEGDFS